MCFDIAAETLEQDGTQRWLRLFDQLFGPNKWNIRRVQAAAKCGSRLK
jgi:hypothetical protein